MDKAPMTAMSTMVMIHHPKSGKPLACWQQLHMLEMEVLGEFNSFTHDGH
jgi:hypothetical protein